MKVQELMWLQVISTYPRERAVHEGRPVGVIPAREHLALRGWPSLR
jgi:hypothetical protein